MILDLMLIPLSAHWWIDAYDAAGNGIVGSQSSDFFCGGVHDPGLPLVIDMFAGSRFAPLGKKFVQFALTSLMSAALPHRPTPGEVVPPVHMSELHGRHLQIATAAYDTLVGQGDAPGTAELRRRV